MAKNPREDLIQYINDTPVEDIKKRVAFLEGAIEELEVDARAYTEAGKVGELSRTVSDLEDHVQLHRILKSSYDILFFAYEYFSDERNTKNNTNLIPPDVTIDMAPDFHAELCSKLGEVREKPTKKIGWGAPRGHAKSAYLTNIFPLHAVLYQYKNYILIISETASMSQNFIEYLSTNLKVNPKLREDFGEVLSPNLRLNDVDNKESFVTHTGIKVQASSIGGQLRGSRFRQSRPDLIIMDDIESGKNTNTQDLRDKNLHWYNSVIEPIGDPARTAFLYMGTLVHGQGLLPDVLARPEYDSQIYSAVVQEPDNQDLWNDFQDILMNVENDTRLEDADRFYYDNREAMDKGVQVLWENRFSYYDLMLKKADVGSRAFASEYLNVPSDEESALFKEGHFQYFEMDGVYDGHNLPYKYDVYGFWDIAMGKNSRSDYNAVVILAKDRVTSVIYILEAWAKKCRPHEAMEKIEELIVKYKPRQFGVETIQAQYEFYRQLQKRLNEKAIYHTRIRDVNPKTKKEQRIEAMEPLFEQGYIKIRDSQRLLKEMLLQYPNHPHDDLPDALAGALEMSRFKVRRAYYKPDGY